MAEVKKNHIAVVIDEKGCEHLAKVKVVNDKELAKLKNELENNKSLELLAKEQHNLKHKEINLKISLLESYLAKSIYDNFVDRGLIENDEDFQKAWFDYFMNDGEPIDFYDTPGEFQKILNKVREL